MAKKRCCSICHNEGHNSRTCNVRDPPENNAAPEATSEDYHSRLQLNLTLGRGSSTEGSASSQQPQLPELAPASNNSSREVQIYKGVRWSPQEHMGFLKGIQFLGRGAWKAISENYVRTRTANQISSHAQKYYKRMKNPLRRKRNPSIFDIGKDEKSQHAWIPFIGLGQISPNNRLHPLPPSPNPGTREPMAGIDQPRNGPANPGTREPMAGIDQPRNGPGNMQIDEGEFRKDGDAG